MLSLIFSPTIFYFQACKTAAAAAAQRTVKLQQCNKIFFHEHGRVMLSVSFIKQLLLEIIIVDTPRPVEETEG